MLLPVNFMLSHPASFSYLPFQRQKKGKKHEPYITFSDSVNIFSGDTFSKIDNLVFFSTEIIHVCFKGFK